MDKKVESMTYLYEYDNGKRMTSGKCLNVAMLENDQDIQSHLRTALTYKNRIAARLGEEELFAIEGVVKYSDGTGGTFIATAAHGQYKAMFNNVSAMIDALRDRAFGCDLSALA